MKQLLYILVCFISISLTAQTALYNSGNMTIHSGSQIGFHTNLINNAPFDDNTGFVGFYGDNLLNIQGTVEPIFNNVEINNEEGVVLSNIGITILGDTTFELGNFIASRFTPNIFVTFDTDATATVVNDDDDSKVDGYAIIRDKQNFKFPVGDTNNYLPLTLDSDAVNTVAKCAYYPENPNAPSTFTTSFITVRKPRIIDYVSNREFWHLESNVNSNVTLSWNANSNLAAITDDMTVIIVVGWSKALQRWVDLGRTASNGTIFNGTVTSEKFNPNDYEIITLGTYDTPTNVLNVDNYLVTPNGDGNNDTLVFEELTLATNSDLQIFDLQIFDRNGLRVFEQENYTNEFNGFANTGSFVLNKKGGLPSGIYFYFIKLRNMDKNFQGFLYLAR